VRFYLLRNARLVSHMAARIAAVLALSADAVAFSVIPVASVAYLLRSLTARPAAAALADDPAAAGAAARVLALENAIVVVLAVEARATAAVLRRASYTRTRSKHVAAQFWANHAARVAAAAVACVVMTAVVLPIGLVVVIQRVGGVLLLAVGLASTLPSRLCVTTYALVEATAAMPPHVGSVAALLRRASRQAAAGGRGGGRRREVTSPT